VSIVWTLLEAGGVVPVPRKVSRTISPAARAGRPLASGPAMPSGSSADGEGWSPSQSPSRHDAWKRDQTHREDRGSWGSDASGPALGRRHRGVPSGAVAEPARLDGVWGARERVYGS